MHEILKTLENHYEYPVDIEFTVNFTQDQKPFVNLLQCRPLQTKGEQAHVEMPSDPDPAKILSAYRDVRANPPADRPPPEKWDGQAAGRIAEILGTWSR